MNFSEKTNKMEGSNYRDSVPFKDVKKSHYLDVHYDIIRIQSVDYPISRPLLCDMSS